jgi:hypothetical protein
VSRLAVVPKPGYVASCYFVVKGIGAVRSPGAAKDDRSGGAQPTAAETGAAESCSGWLQSGNVDRRADSAPPARHRAGGCAAEAPALPSRHRQPESPWHQNSARWLKSSCQTLFAPPFQGGGSTSCLPQILDCHCRQQTESEVEPPIQPARAQAGKTPYGEACCLQLPG